MKIVFLSNYYNHHQKALCAELDRRCASFCFVETSQMREDRRALGYGENDVPAYVVRYSEDTKAQIDRQIEDADAVLWGACDASMVRDRVRQGKLVFRCSERPLKKGDLWYCYIPRYLKWHRHAPKGQGLYLLCASAFAASDYARYGMYRKRAYQWGYFPETKTYELDELMSCKNPTRILWCGRFLDWKHPDDAIWVAKRLKDDGLVFEMNIIGNGVMEETLKAMASRENLEDCVHFLGSMKPTQVREHMEQAGIYLFTSDRQEGWGAVLNESMNAGCAVAASHAIGSVPYVLEHETNGLIYRSGDRQMLYQQVRRLLEHPDEQRRLGRAAYNTIAERWNAAVAAERLLQLAQELLTGNPPVQTIENGPCCKDPMLKDDWYDKQFAVDQRDRSGV